ncbi:Smg-4/UPF3 family-domain-containing protein [Lactifluus volemus]|nr:Smg-4/UPF3 family-domain-containing protein [Lactifluus volemus]
MSSTTTEPPKTNGTERLKTIVRRLPPNLPEHIFWESVQTWVTDDTVLWKEFWPGKLRKKLNRENVHSRAYIAFKTEDLVAKFSREYGGHVFRDKSGNESYAVVEFAPYQKLPLEKKKVDTRNATIDQDEDYIAFLRSLEAPSTKPHDADQLLEMLVASTERPAMPVSTPLLDALKAEKSAQRDKEAIQRNHPHYKDATHVSKKDDSKKKAPAPASAPKQGGESAAPLGKRAAKRAAAAAAAAQKATPQPGSSVQPMAGSAPPSTKPPPSPSKNKSARVGKRHATSSQAQSSHEAQSSNKSPPSSLAVPAEAESPASAPLSPPPATPSDGPGRRPRPVLGIASRQFEVALSGAGVSKTGGGGRRERGADKEEEREKDAAATKDGPSRERKEGGGGRKKKKEDDALGGRQPGVLPTPTILKREAKPQLSRPVQQPPSADATFTAGDVASSNTGAATHGGGRGSGKRGRGRGRGGHRGASATAADS